MAIDVEQLDYLLNDGFDWHWLVGQSVIWHDDKPHPMKILNDGYIGLELILNCDHRDTADFERENYNPDYPESKCQCTNTVYARSGLHSGAWCYVYNVEGEYLANLRDQCYVCDNICGKCKDV